MKKNWFTASLSIIVLIIVVLLFKVGCGSTVSTTTTVAETTTTTAIEATTTTTSGVTTTTTAVTTTTTTSTTTTSTTSTTLEFQVSSNSYSDGATIPLPFIATIAGGYNDSIHLQWSNAPAGTQTFAFSFIDTHEIANNAVHWLVIDIPSSVSSLPSYSAYAENEPRLNGTDLDTIRGSGYIGPYPPSGSGPHTYVLTFYALSTPEIGWFPNATLSSFNSTIANYILAEDSFTGIYEVQ